MYALAECTLLFRPGCVCVGRLHDSSHGSAAEVCHTDQLSEVKYVLTQRVQQVAEDKVKSVMRPYYKRRMQCMHAHVIRTHFQVLHAQLLDRAAGGRPC